MLRLVELHVRKYRDLVDGGPLRFGPGPVFLLGPNGSGKTTLLELIGVLLRDDLSPLFGEDGAVELSWVLEAEGEGELRAPVFLIQNLNVTAQTTPQQSMRPDDDSQPGNLDANKREWRYSAQLCSDREHFDGPAIEVAPGVSPEFKPEINFEPVNGWPDRASDGSYLANLFLRFGFSRARDTKSTERITDFSRQIRPILRGIARSRRFSEATEPFEHIVGAHPDQEVAWAQSLENATPEWPAALFGAPGWAEPLIRWDLTTPIRDDTITIDPLYSLLLQLLGAEKIELHPRLISDNGRGRRFWRGFDLYVHWGGGAKHHHSELSFGQKRLIALIWHLGVAGRGPLITDEMTNGLHAGWVQAIIDHIGPRQGFHAVQNPLLLDRYGPGEGPEEIAGRFVLCTVETAERGRQWRWRSPTPEECERLWQAYIAGYQHLSELLISEGLW